MAAASFSLSFNTVSSSINPEFPLHTNTFSAPAVAHHRSTMRTSFTRPIKAIFTTTATGNPDTTDYKSSSTSGRFNTQLLPKTATLYEVLGVQSNASSQEIKKAYRTLARELHPDVVGGGNRNKDSDFIKVHEAYSILSDPEKRSDYDRAMFIRRSLMNQRSSSFVESSRMSTVGSGFPRRMSRTWETDQCW